MQGSNQRPPSRVKGMLSAELIARLELRTAGSAGIMGFHELQQETSMATLCDIAYDRNVIGLVGQNEPSDFALAVLYRAS